MAQQSKTAVPDHQTHDDILADRITSYQKYFGNLCVLKIPLPHWLVLPGHYSQQFCPDLSTRLSAMFFYLTGRRNDLANFDKMWQTGSPWAQVVRFRKLAPRPFHCLATCEKASKIGTMRQMLRLLQLS